MKQPTFHGRVLLPLSVFADARAGDPLAMERILRYYDGYMNKLCTRTLYELDGTPHVRVDEYMKHRLQNKLIRAILKDSLSCVHLPIKKKNGPESIILYYLPLSI